MKESEYVIVSDLARVRAAIEILSYCDRCEERITVISDLRDWAGRLAGEVGELEQ